MPNTYDIDQHRQVNPPPLELPERERLIRVERGTPVAYAMIVIVLGCTCLAVFVPLFLRWCEYTR